MRLDPCCIISTNGLTCCTGAPCSLVLAYIRVGGFVQALTWLIIPRTYVVLDVASSRLHSRLHHVKIGFPKHSNVARALDALAAFVVL